MKFLYKFLFGVFLFLPFIAQGYLSPQFVNANQLQGNNVSATTPTSNQCLVYTAGVWGPSACGGGSSYTFSDSIVNNAGNVTLVNDSASPGASQYYGTNGSSVLGFFSLPSGGGISGSGTSGQVTVWNGSSSVTGYSGYTADSSGNVTMNSALAPLIAGGSAAGPAGGPGSAYPGTGMIQYESTTNAMKGSHLFVDGSPFLIGIEAPFIMNLAGGLGASTPAIFYLTTNGNDPTVQDDVYDWAFDAFSEPNYASFGASGNYDFTGDVDTSDGHIINMVFGSGDTSQLTTNGVIYNPTYFPNGTYIVSIDSSSSITVSNNALSNSSGVSLHASGYLINGTNSHNLRWNAFNGFGPSDRTLGDIVIRTQEQQDSSHAAVSMNFQMIDFSESLTTYLSFNPFGNSNAGAVVVGVGKNLGWASDVQAGSIGDNIGRPFFVRGQTAMSLLSEATTDPASYSDSDSWYFKQDGITGNPADSHMYHELATGGSNPVTQIQQALILTGTTTNATPTDLVTQYVGFSGNSYNIFATCTAAGSTNHAGFKIANAFYDSGSMVKIGAVDTSLESIATAGGSGMGIAFGTSGNNVKLTVTGVVSEDIDWDCKMEIQSAE